MTKSLDMNELKIEAKSLGIDEDTSFKLNSKLMREKIKGERPFYFPKPKLVEIDYMIT